MDYTIGIVGGGFVGQVLKKYYPKALVYDSNGKFDKLENVLGQEIIFIAFNLKDNGLESYESVATYLRQAPENRIFIIKSTFIPGTTDKLQDEFPQHRVIYNPEFLTEATAWWDFTKPHAQILGIPHVGLKLAPKLFALLPDAPVKRIISPRDAEVLKHATNSYYATKLIFFNQLFDICKQLEADYETLRESMSWDERIGNSHNIIKHKGYRGFGNQEVSKCLPKDIEALARVSGSPLLNTVIELNNRYFNEKM